MTTAAGAPESAMPMLDGQTETTPWAVALDRLEHPALGQNHWLATVRPDGWPHLMPIIACAIYRLEPTKVFGQPGMFGMFEHDQSHEPRRWTFPGDSAG